MHIGLKVLGLGLRVLDECLGFRVWAYGFQASVELG